MKIRKSKEYRRMCMCVCEREREAGLRDSEENLEHTTSLKTPGYHRMCVERERECV
jgi:hypothetical protein